LPFSLSWARVLLGVTVVAGATIGIAAPNKAHLVRPLIIRGEFKGLPVIVTATERSAGAIESLQWGGVEYLDANDHGRDLQSAISYDGLKACDNPTEAGSSKDGNGPHTSSSVLLRASTKNNELRTYAQMAYWLRPGQSHSECGAARNETDSKLSNTFHAKAVRFLPGFDNVLEHAITFEMPRARDLAQFEALTAYMPETFSSFHLYNPAKNRMQPLSDGPGEQGHPVVLATRDGQHALGLMTLQEAGPGMRGPGYGRWRFGWERVTKSNVVFRLKNAPAGAHRFVVYSVFGTLEDVRQTMHRIYQNGGADVASRAVPPQRPAGARLGVLAEN
jgi:hypothetical protein